MIFDTLQTIAAFVLTLGILVSIHEFGHFWVAKRCGVKVLRFSVGFGKSLWRWYDKQGTEFSIGLIPLGGYVKMLDEREAPVADDEKHLSFNNKPVLSRIAIVAAGPIANFLLAIAALWLMYLLGVKVLAPKVGKIMPESPAAIAGIKAGDEIISIAGKKTPSWQAVNMALLPFLGDSTIIPVTVLADKANQGSMGSIYKRSLVVNNWLIHDKSPHPIRALGILPFSPKVPAIIGKVIDGGEAKKSGIIAGDQIISSDGMPIKDWMQWVELVRAHPGTTMQVDLLRDKRKLTVHLVPRVKENNNTRIGYIGASVKPISWPDSAVRTLKFGPIKALVKGVESTWSLTMMTLSSIWKMVIGLISIDNLSGPITIAKFASASLESGFESFLYFLGMLSVSLGVLNLLPIPMLDGGHLLFYLIEWVRKKPIAENIQLIGLKIGSALVISIMMLALYNDLIRLF